MSPVPPLLERQPQSPRPRRHPFRRRRRCQRRGAPRSAPPAGQPGLAGREHPPSDGPRGECPEPAPAPAPPVPGTAPRLPRGVGSMSGERRRCPRPPPRWSRGVAGARCLSVPAPAAGCQPRKPARVRLPAARCWKSGRESRLGAAAALAGFVISAEPLSEWNQSHWY